MYARYLKEREPGSSSYQFVEQCSLFGCNEGFIPWLLNRRISSSQGEPYKWRLPIQDSLNGAKSNDTDYTGSTLIIDLKPKQNKKNLSLYEVLDVWGYSDEGWPPILLHLSGLFVDADPNMVDRNKFFINDSDRDEPIYEFMYLDGSVADGRLEGRWKRASREPDERCPSLAGISGLLFYEYQKTNAGGCVNGPPNKASHYRFVRNDVPDREVVDNVLN